MGRPWAAPSVATKGANSGRFGPFPEMDTDTPFPAVDAHAQAMMNSLGQLSLILGHMHRYQAEAPDAPEPPFVLTDRFGS
jgi:hypothetical protein